MGWDGVGGAAAVHGVVQGSTRYRSISAPGEALPQSSPNGQCRGSSERGSEAVLFHQTALPQHFQKDAQWKSDKSQGFWAGGLLLAFQEMAGCGAPVKRQEFLSVGFTTRIC